MSKDEAFGPHLTLDLWKCNFEKLKDFDLVFDVLNELPEKMGMTKISAPYVVKWKDKFATTLGISGFVIIAESHISIHTFPDQDYVFIDAFSCRSFDYEGVKKYLIKIFEAKGFESKVINRGNGFERKGH